MHCRSRFTPSCVIHGCIMLLGCINVSMAQYVGYKVYVTCFLIESSTISASELMGGDFLGCSNCPCIFFYKVFYSLDTNAFSLSRVEESVFMSGYRSNSLPNCTTISLPPFRVILIPLFLKSISSTSSPTHSDTRIPVPSRRVTIARSRSFVFS